MRPVFGGVTLFLATKDETSGILKSFITGIENLVDHKVKVIRCDNGTEFKNREMNQFCEIKGILRQFSVARTPQQNRVAERKNMTLIEAAKTMLADSKLPTTFWAEAANTACYVQKQVIMQVKLERRQNLSKITFCYHYGLLIHNFPKIQRVLMMMDPNLQVMMERSSTVNAAGINEVNAVGGKTCIELPFDPNMPALEDYRIFDFIQYDTSMNSNPIITGIR
ncbi:putative ribonuclease H-like domain-containing protein [Tanacetum coccineum]